MPKIPNEMLDNNKDTERIRFSSKLLDKKYISLEILEGNKTVERKRDIPKEYNDFLPFIENNL